LINRLLCAGFRIIPFGHNVYKCTKGFFLGMALINTLHALKSNEAQIALLGAAIVAI
jgi:hypothetical protein